MKSQAYLIHALSPLHAGTGHTADIVDLPIARMQATGIPILPGSSIKGVLRDARSAGDGEKLAATFGPPTGDPSQNAGALSVGDARLLALPVRSMRGAFAWVSSPLLLGLARRDVGAAGNLPIIAPLEGHAAIATSLAKNTLEFQGRIFLGDLDLPVSEADAVASWSDWIARQAFAEEAAHFSRRFVVVDDETMTFLWRTATQVDTRVRLDNSTRTVAQGALWIEESLPPETLLVGLMAADRSRRAQVNLSADQVLEVALPDKATLQFGGKASVGRGRCRIIPVRD